MPYCKYYKEKEEVSYDSGATWSDTGRYAKGELYESDSKDCESSAKWVAYYWRDPKLRSSGLCDSSSTVYTNLILPTGFTSVTIGDCVTSIEGPVMSAGSPDVASVTMPDTVASIGNYAFYDSRKLVRINSDEDNVFNLPRNLTSIGYSAFENCTKMYYVNIPDGVTSIGNEAFYYCYNLKDVSIPYGVRNIEDRTFMYCNHLSAVTIGDGCRSIGNDAFHLCNLKTVTIGSGIRTIGDYAFDFGGGSPCSVTINATSPPRLGNNSFNILSSDDVKIYVPAGSVDYYKSSSYWTDYVDYIYPIP